MLGRDPFTQEFIPNLAESWKLSDDGLTCDVYLRRNVTFHDGYPLTADDVVFTYNDLLDNKEIDVGGKGALLFRKWNPETQQLEEHKMKVRKIDDYTVRFTFPYKTFRSMDRIATKLIYPKHILKKYVDNGTFNTTWDIGTDPREIIGSGKYMPWEFVPGERFTVKRNPDYWKKDTAGNSLPYIDKIVFHTIVSHDTAILRFLAGDLDFLPLRGEDVPILEPQQAAKDFTIFGTGPNTTIRYIVFNQNFGTDPATGTPYVEPHKLKWFTNKKFRQAMSYALDRETWINNFMNGFGVPLWGPLSPASLEFYCQDVKQYPFDLGKAAGLLDEIGYVDSDGDGIREDPDGNDITYTILGRARDEKEQRPINMFISDLSAIGVKATLVIQQSSTFLDSLWTNFSFECAYVGELAGVEVDSITQGLFASYSTYRYYKPNYLSDYTPVPENIEHRFSWEDDIDRLLSEYSQELDREKRKTIGYEVQRLLSEELPLIFTVTDDRVFAIRNKWKNFCPTPGFYPSVWRNFEYMYEEKP
jgi:peptide/nickel transport system substrate-binding protein